MHQNDLYSFPVFSSITKTLSLITRAARLVILLIFWSFYVTLSVRVFGSCLYAIWQRYFFRRNDPDAYSNELITLLLMMLRHGAKENSLPNQIYWQQQKLCDLRQRMLTSVECGKQDLCAPRGTLCCHRCVPGRFPEIRFQSFWI